VRSAWGADRSGVSPRRTLVSKGRLKDSMRYTERTCGWYHPSTRLRTLQDPSADVRHAWAATIRKSKDHIGYGDGTIGYGDVQETAVSRDAPDWFPGVRMVPGPYGIPRFPAIGFENSKLQTTYPRFSKGPNLSVIQVDDVDYPPSTAGSAREYSAFDTARGTYARNVERGDRCVHGSLICDGHPCSSHLGKDTASNLLQGGCIVATEKLPPSNAVLFAGVQP